MRVRAAQAGFLFLVLIVGGIVISIITGYWATEGSKVPVTYTEGKFAGENNPADIRGSYSFSDIEKAFEIPVATLASAFGFSSEENPGIIQIKLFEEVFGIIDGKEIGTDSMRYFVALYKGLPYIPEADTALPKPAVSILRKEGLMTDEQLAEADAAAVTLELTHIVTGTIEDHEEMTAMEIKGKTTFADLYDWGVNKDELEKILGIPVGARTETIRDYCMDNGIEFSTVKTPVQVLLDKM